MSYYLHNENKYTHFEDLRKALEKNPSESPAHFVKGNRKRRIDTASPYSVLNFTKE